MGISRIFLLSFLLFGLVSCEALSRAGKAATTPSDKLEGKTPLEVIVTNIPALAAGIASGNLPGAVKSGTSIWESIGLILAAAVGTGGAGAAVVAQHAASKRKTIKQIVKSPVISKVIAKELST